MSVMVQIRNVPRETHRILKARAARRGQTLSGYLLGELQRVAELPTSEEFLRAVGQREPPPDPINSAAAVRLEREGRRR